MARLIFDDTDMIPGQPWRVHDSRRPQPRIVTPGAEPGRPPSDAVVLFNGTDLSEWESAVNPGEEAGWKVADGCVEVVPGTGDIQTVRRFGDCQVHLEWATPAEVTGDCQLRGNSGVYLMGLYEISILDGYDNPTYADGAAASIYGQFPPFINACRAPGDWQSFDIIFETPRWDEGWLVEPARLTVLHNGLLVHHRQEAMGPTVHLDTSSYASPHDEEGPLLLQDHGPMLFRNIWIRPLTDYDAA